MKIFSHAPITERMQATHTIYYNYISRLDHIHTTDFCIRLSPQDLLKTAVRKQANDLLLFQENNIRHSDVIVFGASEQSIGIGVYLHMAIQFSKPIIALCENIHTMPFLYEAIIYEKLITRECTLKNYKTIIPEALQEAKKLIDKRFTLLLPPDVVEILQNHYETIGQSRSDLIRDLLREYRQKQKVPKP